MIGVILLSLLMTTIVVALTGLLMFWDVAFCEPSQIAVDSKAKAARRDGYVPGYVDGVGLALRVEQAVSQLVQRLGARPASGGLCDGAAASREIRVTTPEVLAIVHDLRDHLPSDQVGAIREQAQRNLLLQQVSNRCPLLLSNGSCACSMARPVSCRAHCLSGDDSQAGSRMADSVGAGATEIFRDCLSASGLDDSEYELNQALVQAMTIPHAARRWAQGERILALTPSCRA